MILRFGDVPLTQNTNSNDMCCIGTVDNECDSLNNCPDSTWVYALGWALCLLGLLIFLIAAFEELLSQIDYGIWNVRFSWFMELLINSYVYIIWTNSCYYFLIFVNRLQKLKSSVKTDRNWGPEDPMLQYQWYQLKKSSENEEFSSTENECKETKNVKVIMQRLFSTSAPDAINNGYKGN